MELHEFILIAWGSGYIAAWIVTLAYCRSFDMPHTIGQWVGVFVGIAIGWPLILYGFLASSR